MRKRNRYDDKFRASAVIMLEAAGYPDKKGALAAVAKNLDVPAPTLHRWIREKNNPPPSDVVNEKRMDLKEMLKAEINGALGEMPNARIDASYRDLGTVAAILIDKLQLLEGKATERIEHNATVTHEERVNRIATILDAARDRRARPADIH